MAFNSISSNLKAPVRAVVGLMLAFAMIVMACTQAKAQTFAEWFKQGSTQRKYLLQQIEALQVYHSYLRKGYDVAKGGIGSITGSLTNEFNRHSSYYTGLRKVKSAISGDENVNEILSWQQDILQLTGGWERIEGLSSDESHYLSAVRNDLLTDCIQLISTLENVIGDGKLEMNDSERIKLILRLHAQMQENYRFATGFTRQAKNYAVQRSQEKNNVITIKKIYGND